LKGVFVLCSQEIDECEYQTLNSYAALSKNASRSKPLEKHPLRTKFQRDRDRILHSKAFRRLEYKTQVFTTQINDHLRTRLTHSLEVSQIARTIAKALKLNTDLVEAISLGHDLGHAPFGHAGENKLSELLKEDGIGVFKHNVQSVRILQELEKKYDYDGLRLTDYVLEGILKHTDYPKVKINKGIDLRLDLKNSITLEGQLVAVVDEIAQITHDMDDYLRYNIIDFKKIKTHKFIDEIKDFYKKNYDYCLDEHLEQIEEINREKDVMIRCMVDYLSTTLIDDSKEMINSFDKLTPGEITQKLIDYKEPRKELIKCFHDYLNEIVFNNYKVDEMDKRGRFIISTLYNHYKSHPDKLPERTLKKYKNGNSNRVLADYISGMTDRYALNRYNKMIRFDNE